MCSSINHKLTVFISTNGEITWESLTFCGISSTKSNAGCFQAPLYFNFRIFKKFYFLMEDWLSSCEISNISFTTWICTVL